VRYGKQLVKLGGPVLKSGTLLIGQDSGGAIETELVVSETKKLSYKFHRDIDPGTNLTYKPNWRETDQYLQNCYMDNRLGIWSALQVAETLKDGLIVFSCWEETGGGSVGYLSKYIYEQMGVRQALISDITWVTEGVHHGKGVAISMRDSGIPRKSYVNRIVSIARANDLMFQLEVEDAGGSDGNALQKSPYPFDWCFVGAPEDHVHSPDEKVHKDDIIHMVRLYRVLMESL
jgi:putative aminopeptidase FrvX